MKPEYLDIVDQNNQPTGEKKLRSEVHTNGYWHRTVHIYFFRVKNGHFEILVHLRAKNKDLHPNCWDTRFGGHLQTGETPDQAVLAELKEEVGLDLGLSDLISGPITKSEYFPNNEFNYVYFYKFNDDISKLKFQDNEVQKVKWMKAEDISKDMKDNQSNWSANLKGFENIVNYLTK